MRDVLVDAARLVGRGADHDDAAARGEIAEHGREEFVQRLEPLGGGDAGGVEDQPAERVGPAAADVVADQFVVVGQRGAKGFGDPALAADQHRPGQRRITGPVPAQFLRLRHAELLGQERSGAGVDHLGEQVGSHFAAFRGDVYVVKYCRVDHELTPE